jgi:CRP-like cAMP-binding protein
MRIHVKLDMKRAHRDVLNAIRDLNRTCHKPFSGKVIAEAAGCTERTVFRAIGRFEANGILKVHRRKGGQASTYELIRDDNQVS